MKKLKLLMKARDVKPEALAKEIGVHVTSVFCWLREQYLPSKKNAKKIIAFFNGELTFNDIYG